MPVEWAIGARIDADWDDLDALAHPEDFQLPILLFHGTEDKVVPISTSNEFAAELPRWVTYYRVPQGRPHRVLERRSEAVRRAPGQVPGRNCHPRTPIAAPQAWARLGSNQRPLACEARFQRAEKGRQTSIPKRNAAPAAADPLSGHIAAVCGR